MKQVQISEDLFLSLIEYHILEYYNDEEKIVKEFCFNGGIFFIM